VPTRHSDRENSGADVTRPATRIVELEDDQLEESVEIYAERKSKDYVEVERVGAPNDKGRDGIGFLSRARHEGGWDLYQCKRKTRGSKLRMGEAMTELGKVFHHYAAAGYATLPRRYVFVSPRCERLNRDMIRAGDSEMLACHVRRRIGK